MELHPGICGIANDSKCKGELGIHNVMKWQHNEALVVPNTNKD